MTNVEILLQAMPGALEWCRMLGLAVPRGSRADRLRICCPWHNEKNPSCNVQTNAQGRVVAYCHACHENGDGFSLAAAAWGMSTKTEFPEVLQRVAETLGVTLPESPREHVRMVRDVIDDIADRIDAWVDRFIEGKDIRPSLRDDAVVMKATASQRQEAYRRLDLRYALAREARVRAAAETDEERVRNDELEAMAGDVLMLAAQREAAALKRLGMQPDLLAIQGDDDERRAIQDSNEGDN